MIDIFFIALTVGIGLLMLPRMQQHWQRWLLLLVACAGMVELSLEYDWLGAGNYANQIVNVFTCLEFCFYFYLFYIHLNSPKLRQAALWSIPVFLLLAILNMSFYQGFHKFHTITYRVASLGLFFFCYQYFRQLMQDDREVNVLRTPMFWVATAILFFYGGFFFYFTAFDYIAYTKSPVNKAVWVILSRFLNVVLYSIIAISFVCPFLKGRSSK